jgi:hypothetical protein
MSWSTAELLTRQTMSLNVDERGTVVGRLPEAELWQLSVELDFPLPRYPLGHTAPFSISSDLFS